MTHHDNDYAPADIRDQFLGSLEEADGARALRLARHLTSCGNPLPSTTCLALGLPPGSSYASAARRVLERQSAPPRE